MKKLFALSLVLLASFAIAAPFNITATFDPPSTGPVPDSYNLYVDDCAATGPVGAPLGPTTTGQEFVDALANSGQMYQVCIRTVLAGAENPDPGPVADVTPQDLAGVIENLQIIIACPTGNCTSTTIIN